MDDANPLRGTPSLQPPHLVGLTRLLTSDVVTATSGSTTTTRNLPTGLDTTFPVDTGTKTSDSPALILTSQLSKQTWNPSFTMYFMWRPGLANDIPVILGYTTRTAFGDGAQSGGTWTVQPDSTARANSFVQTFVYPTWSNKVTRGTQSCQ